MSPLFFYSEILEYFSAQSQSEKGLADESECTQISNTLLHRRAQLSLLFTCLTLFANKAVVTQLSISQTNQKQTTSLIHLMFCGYAHPGLTRDQSRQAGIFAPGTAGVCCSQTHKAVQRHPKKENMDGAVKVHLLSSSSHYAHAQQELAAESNRGPRTMSLWDTVSHLSVSSQPCSSHHLSAQHSSPQPAKNPYQTTSLITFLF